MELGKKRKSRVEPKVVTSQSALEIVLFREKERGSRNKKHHHRHGSEEHIQADQSYNQKTKTQPYISSKKEEKEEENRHQIKL